VKEAHPELRLARRPLLLLLILLPLLFALFGFAVRGRGAPEWPGLPTDIPPRGSIVARDGTILAEGPATHRRYPQGSLAAHLVGFSGRIQPDGRYGLEGLEYMYDSYLQTGATLVTTIDPVFQAVAQAKLQETMLETEAENGMVVILEAGSGEILASASYPVFDPNDLGSSSQAQLINRAFLQQYEPGSVMKPFVIAALLEAGRLESDELIDAEPARRVGNKTFRDVVSHDPQLLPKDVLSVSSNTAMLHLTERFQPQELYAWLQHFGFAQDLGMTSSYTRRGSMNSWQNWVPQDQASITIGQGVSTTAVQLAAIFSILANDGFFVTPSLVQGEATPAPRAVLSPGTAAEVRSMLEYTVENSGLRNSRIPGVTLAGKTGTADVYDIDEGRYIPGDYTLTFAGMFPADEPRVVMVVSVHKPRRDTTATYVAAPLFRAIGTEVVAQWDTAPPRNPLADVR
jgi:cell division protein FtsI (penicillin-binding protein 3)